MRKGERDPILEAAGDEPRSGFEIAELLAETTGHGPRDEAAIYPTLHRLEADGRLEAAWLPDAAGAFRRRYSRRRSRG